MSGSAECPSCGRDDFASALGMKKHHSRAHGTSYYTEISDQLLDDLREFARRVESAPTATQMADEGPWPLSAYKTAFGSWNQALGAAGLNVQKHHNIPVEDLLDEIQRISDGSADGPTAERMRQKGSYTVSAYINAFGSWRAAVKAAGYEPNALGGRTDHAVSDRELLDEISRLANGGVPPKKGDMEVDGAYSSTTYENHFGNWTNAVEAAGYEARRYSRSFYESVRDATSEKSWPRIRAEEKEESCEQCGDGSELQVHHVVPVLCGGTNEAWNLMTLCKSCHRSAEAISRTLAPRLVQLG